MVAPLSWRGSLSIRDGDENSVQLFFQSDTELKCRKALSEAPHCGNAIAEKHNSGHCSSKPGAGLNGIRNTISALNSFQSSTTGTNIGHGTSNTVPQVLRNPLRGGDGSRGSETELKTSIDVGSCVKHMKCQNCNSTVFKTPQDILNLFKNWYTGKSPVSSVLQCKSCSASICLGCGASNSQRSLTQISTQKHFCDAKLREAATTGTGQVYSGSGVGYGGSQGFLGLVDNDYEDTFPPRFKFASRHSRATYIRAAGNNTGKAKAQNVQHASDNFVKVIFAILEELLPSQDKANKSTFDGNPPEAIVSMLLHSKILSKMAELLRNDSLDDATQRKDVYQGLLNVLRILGNHSTLARPTIFQERPNFGNNITLSMIAFKNVDSKTKETTTPLSEVLRNLEVQCKTMLTAASHNEKEFRDSDGQNMLWLCRQISDLSDWLFVNTAAGSQHKLTTHTDASDHGILEIPDEHIFRCHFYAKHALKLQRSMPGRIKRLITEITTLKTGLPPGIFVRYASSRLDVMKILIVGPNDTPYENGLYEFDLFCPGNYPNFPPQMRFRGTNNGHLDINPNLHADGEVCLSLLGTWQGEPWRPGKSTILQVLISIQAMIFCDTPMNNEPGLSNSRDSAESEMYNRQIRIWTVRYAMLDWLQKQPELWKDVVNLHFKRRASRIISTVARWEQISGRSGAHYGGALSGFPGRVGQVGSLSTLRPQLQAALQNLGSNVPIHPDVQSTQLSGRPHGGQGPVGRSIRHGKQTFSNFLS